MWEDMSQAEKRQLIREIIFWSCATLAMLFALGYAFNRALNLSGFPF